MKKRLYCLIAAMAIPLCHRAHAEVIVIANPSVSAAAASRSDLRDLFTGASSSLKDGSRVTPVLLKPGPESEEFLALYVGKSDSAFRAGWRSLLFSGEAVMPRTFDSQAALVDYVAHTPGAIGYIDKATPHDNVKVLTAK